MWVRLAGCSPFWLRQKKYSLIATAPPAEKKEQVLRIQDSGHGLYIDDFQKLFKVKSKLSRDGVG